MTPEELGRVRQGENERVEWKETASDAEALLHAVCALANDLNDSGTPGFVVIGLTNQGQVRGTDISDEAQQRLTNRLTSIKIVPNPSCSIETVQAEGRDLLVVRVQPYAVPPVVMVDRVPWVRVGTTTRRATDADVTRLQERRPENALPFDLRSLQGATLADLDLTQLRATYEAQRIENHDLDTYPEFEKWLAQQDLVRNRDGTWVPNPAAILVYGIDPQTHFPGAIIEFARYAGNDFDSQIASRKPISGNLRDQLDVLWAQLNAHVAEIPTAVDGIRTPYVPQYPLDALKELARNAVQHRLYQGTNAPIRVSWFDDRIVFNNPGGPFGQASEGEFGSHSDYRNPTITRLLAGLGYVERLGRGIRIVRTLLQRNGNPPLVVETDGFTTVTVRNRP